MAFNNFENEIFDSASDGNGHAGNRNAAMPVVVNLLGDTQEVDTSQSAIQVDTTTSDEVSEWAGREAEPEVVEQVAEVRRLGAFELVLAADGGVNREV